MRRVAAYGRLYAFSVVDVAMILYSVADALAHVHALCVIHNDIKCAMRNQPPAAADLLARLRRSKASCSSALRFDYVWGASQSRASTGAGGPDLGLARRADNLMVDLHPEGFVRSVKIIDFGISVLAPSASAPARRTGFW